MFYFSLILHILVTLLSFGCFIMGINVWRKTAKTSQYWRFFTIGFLFIWLAELVDIFAPIYKQQFGGINFYTETTQGVGLAFVFLGIIAFLRKRIEALDSKEAE